MSDPRKLRDMAEWFDRQDMHQEANDCLDIADRYVQMADDNAVLEIQVNRLADELAQHENVIKDIGIRFGIDQSNAAKIAKRKLWKHV